MNATGFDRIARRLGTGTSRRRLVASLKRTGETVTGQIARARAALYPGGRPQERVLTLASFLVRYGPGLLDDLAAEVARGMGAP